MKQKTGRKLLGVLLVLTMVFELLPGMSLTALADTPGVPYLAWDDAEKKLVEKTGENACREYTVVSADTTTWGESNAEKWYVANGDITISERVRVEGTANLILCDGATLTIKKGITVKDGNALNIYAQSRGTGMLYAGTADGTDRTCDDNYAGIGSDSEHLGGNITIHGGTITATGGKAAPGIGICTYKSYAVLKVYGGNIKATGGDGNGSDNKPGGAGISYIMDPVSGDATITAIGGEGAKNSDGVYVTDGGDGIGGSINVTGDSPKITATGGDGSTDGVEGSIAGSGIRLRWTYQTVLTALTVSGGSPTITATGGNTTTGRGGKGISIGTNVKSTALKIVSGSPQITSTGGNSTSGEAGEGIYGSINIMTDSETTSVLAIHGDGKEGKAYAICGPTTVSAGFAAFNRMSEDAPWYIDSNLNGQQTTTITSEGFVIENKYGRIFKSYYSVVLDQNGGSGIFVDPLYYGLGETMTVPANTYTRNGYSFTGWNTKEDGSGKPYADGAAITVSAGATDLDEFGQLILYAQWEKYPDPVITRSPAVISGLVYNGKAQVLITEGEVTGGKMQYALGKDATTEPTENWSASIPTAIDADTYYVWYKVVGDDNHNDTEPVCVSMKIDNAKAVPVTVTANNRAYDGTAQPLVTVTGETVGGTVYYAVTTENTAPTDASLYTTSIPAKTDAGTYYVWYKVVGDDNHNDTEPACVNVKIDKAKAVPATVTANNRAYDSTAQPLVTVTGDAVGGTMYYAETTENTAPTDASLYTTSIPAKTDAGTYYVWYKVVGDDNHNDTEPACVNVKIDKAKTVPATVTANNRTYDSTAQPLVTVTGDAVGGTMYYAVTTENTVPTDASLYTTSIPAKTDAGTYYVWYLVDGGDNFESIDATYIEVTISTPDSSENGGGSSTGGSDYTGGGSGTGGSGYTGGGSGIAGSGTGATNGASSGSGSKTGKDNTSGSGSKTGSDNTSGSGATTDSDVKVKENADGTKTEIVETTNTDGSTTKTQTTKDAEGNTLQTVTQTTKETDNGTVTNTVTKDADGTVLKTVTQSTEKNDDGSTVTTKSTVNSDGTGSSKSTTVDENNNVISTTSTKTTKNKKGTVKVKSETENLEATGSEIKHINSTVKTYTSGKVKSEITETKADGSSVKTENTIKADKEGNLTVTSKVTEKDADGNTTKSITTATVKVKKSGALTLSKIDAKGEVAVIPDSVVSNGKTVPVTTIGKGAMQGNETITDVKLGDNITKISKNAFKGDKNLEHIELTDSIKSIAKNAFKGIAKDAVFTIKAASEKEFNRIVDLIKNAGVGKKVTFVFENTSK